MQGNRISPNFTFAEFTKSNTATSHHINNAITEWDVRDNIISLVQNILQPARDAWEEPMFINSGYRCKELNELVGGVESSQHRKGQAADVGVSDPYEFAKLVKKMNLPYDQMIIYPTFVHLSYKKNGENRGQLLYNKRWKGPKDL